MPHMTTICHVSAPKFETNALYDAYDESDDTEENSKSGYLKGVGR